MFCPRDVLHLLTDGTDEVAMLTLCVERIVTRAAHDGAEVLEDWP